MPLYTTSLSNMGILDSVRLNYGTDKLKTYFYEVALQNKEKAIELLNDKSLQFPTLFSLQPEIKKFDLYDGLSPRNQYSINITEEILARKISDSGRLSPGYRDNTLSVLRWMLQTGYSADGLNNQYDEVLEVAAILLIKAYNDVSVLNIVVELIFNRYKKGTYIYDLVWAFFESRDPQHLTLIASRLRSNEWKDVELARKLLKFVPCIAQNRGMDNTRLYSAAIDWIKENYPFLQYTGESYQQHGDPKPYEVSDEAKYLCKTVLINNGDAFRSSLTEDENTRLESFKKLDDDTQKLLSDCSYKLYRQNFSWWRTWMGYPVDEQVRMAKRLLGGLS